MRPNTAKNYSSGLLDRMASRDTGVPTSSYVGQNTTVDRTEYQMGGSGLNNHNSSNIKKNTITQIEDLIMGH